MYVRTKPLLSTYFFSVGCRFMKVSILQGSYPFLNKNFPDFSRTFKDTFAIFAMTLFSAKKESWVDVFFSSSITWVILSGRSSCVCSFVFGVLLNYKVSIEFQGLSSTTAIFKDFQGDFQGSYKPWYCTTCKKLLTLSMASLQHCSTPNKKN